MPAGCDGVGGRGPAAFGGFRVPGALHDRRSRLQSFKEGGAFLLGEIVDEHFLVWRRRPCTTEQLLNWELQALASTGLHRLSGHLVRKGKRHRISRPEGRQGPGIPEALRGMPCKHPANRRRRTGPHRSPLGGRACGRTSRQARQNSTKQDGTTLTGLVPSVFYSEGRGFESLRAHCLARSGASFAPGPREPKWTRLPNRGELSGR